MLSGMAVEVVCGILLTTNDKFLLKATRALKLFDGRIELEETRRGR